MSNETGLAYGAEDRRRSPIALATAFGFLLVAAGFLLFGIGILFGGEAEGLVVFTVFAIVALVPAFLVMRFGSWAYVVAVLFALLAMFFWLPGIGIALQYPNAFFDFTTTLLAVVGAVIALVSAIAGIIAWRRGNEGAATWVNRRALAGIAGVLAVLGLISLILTVVTREDVSEADQQGATEVRMEKVEFDPDRLEVSAGDTVRLFVDNQDPFVHTFTIDRLDVDEGFSPESDKIIEFTVPDAGEYEFYCEVPGHEDMKGTLVAQP